MQYEQKILLLKALTILKQIPERQLAALAEFLRPKELEDGGLVFEEGSIGMSLYFVSSGYIRIFKRVADGAFKDLAILGPGEFFGEMALVEEASRSAGARAVGKCVLFELFRGDLSRWVKSNPQQAVQFFAELVHLQSKRLRRTSNELTLHFDLSALLLDPGKIPAEFMTQVLDRILPHLEGAWSAAAYLRQDTSGALEAVASRGSYPFERLAAALPSDGGAACAWIDGSTFHVALAGQRRTPGLLIFHADAGIAKEDREDIGRSLTTVARLVATALELQQLSRPAAC